MMFYLGETKEVRIVVYNRKNEPFTIRNATYSIKRLSDDVVIEEGNAYIDEHELSVFWTPPERGIFGIYYTYEVAGERLKAFVKIEVV